MRGLSKQLNIEALRGKIKDPNLRTCILCQDPEPDDKFNFFMSCTNFQPDCAKLFAELIKRTSNFVTLNNECRLQ